MRFNKKASLEIGINTIVILVIAMMLGLGIGFVKGIFGKANTLPDLIDTSNWQNPPTASEPVRLTPSSLEIKAGKSKDVKIGVYNKAQSKHTFDIAIGECVGPDENKPTLQGLSIPVEAGEAKARSYTIFAKTGDETKLSQGKYICSITATAEGGSLVYDTDFVLKIV